MQILLRTSVPHSILHWSSDSLHWFLFWLDNLPWSRALKTYNSKSCIEQALQIFLSLLRISLSENMQIFLKIGMFILDFWIIKLNQSLELVKWRRSSGLFSYQVREFRTLHVILINQSKNLIKFEYLEMCNKRCLVLFALKEKKMVLWLQRNWWKH